MTVDVRAIDADALFCSPYKFFGPHLGIMFGKRELLESWQPDKVRPAPDSVPERWETGTLNHEGLAGLIAAVDYLAGLGGTAPGRREAVVAGMVAIRRHEAGLSERFLRGLPERVRLFGVSDPARVDERAPTFALRVHDRSPREVAEELGHRGIFVWDGNYYAQTIMERLGLEETGGAVRVGFCHYHTTEEVDRVLQEFAEIARG